VSVLEVAQSDGAARGDAEAGVRGGLGGGRGLRGHAEEVGGVDAGAVGGEGGDKVDHDAAGEGGIGASDVAAWVAEDGAVGAVRGDEGDLLDPGVCCGGWSESERQRCCEEG